jgi:CubicO group peptidase (beta-lactamase class C family)
MQFGFPENAGLSSVRLISRIDSIVQAGLDSLAFPGCHVLIARRGIVVLEQMLRIPSLRQHRGCHEHDLWDLASVTKVSAATPSLMLLDDRGLFDLTGPWVITFPGFVFPTRVTWYFARCSPTRPV